MRILILIVALFSFFQAKSQNVIVSQEGDTLVAIKVDMLKKIVAELVELDQIKEINEVLEAQNVELVRISEVKDDVINAQYNQITSLSRQQELSAIMLKSQTSQLNSANSTIELLRKTNKKEKRRAFFQGTGLGTLVGIIAVGALAIALK